MKSKVKYAVLVLVIGLLGLAILASPVFGGGPKPPYKYNIKIVDSDNKTVAEFVAAGNKDGTRIVGSEKYQQGMVKDVDMNFPDYLVAELNEAEDEAASFNKYPDDRPLYWSPLEDNYLELPKFVDCHKFDGSLDKHWQYLDSEEWEYHSGRLNYKKNTLSFRFDLFYEYYDQDGLGAHDHYVLGIEMGSCILVEEPYEYRCAGEATLNWTHYTETTTKTKGKKLAIQFQQLKDSSSGPLTITITEKED